MCSSDMCDLEAQRLVAFASAHGLTVATAESCTAGRVAAVVGGVPGASEVLRGGAVTYVNEIKHRVLGVSEKTLATVGAVSERCACEMAAGARALFGSDAAVSITGFAGPGGGTADNPVGTVYLGIADQDGARAVRRHFNGDRDDVRWQATMEALRLLRSSCEDIVLSRG